MPITQCPHCESGHSPEYTRLKALWYGEVEFTPAVPYTADNPVIIAVAKRNFLKFTAFDIGRTLESEINRLVASFNRQMAYHLNEEDAKALVASHRPYELTKTWDGENHVLKPEDQLPNAKDINEWAMTYTLGHDSINCYIVLKSRLAQQGLVSYCAHCLGSGEVGSADTP